MQRAISVQQPVLPANPDQPSATGYKYDSDPRQRLIFLHTSMLKSWGFFRTFRNPRPNNKKNLRKKYLLF
jgi:hypothetical protein